MRLKTTLLYVFHTACIGAVLSLAGFVVREKWGDGEADLQREMRAAMNVASANIDYYNKDYLTAIEQYVGRKPSPNLIGIWQRASALQVKSDSMVVLLDGLNQQPNAEQLFLVQANLRIYCFEAQRIMSPYFQQNLIDKLPIFDPPDWLFRAWKHNPPEQFANELAEATVKVRLIELAALSNCLRQTGIETDCSFEKQGILLDFDEIGPAVGDTVRADLVRYVYRSFGQLALRLDGIELPPGEGSPFSVRHDKPGNYPLRFSIEQRDRLTDSVRVFEKTYWLRVRE